MAMPMSADQGGALLTVVEVAERVRVGQETVRRWLRTGQLRGVRLARKAGWRIREQDLDAFLETHFTTPPGE